MTNSLKRVVSKLRSNLSYERLRSLVVGLDGLEPSTSRLSGVRSNHLSYRPLTFWWSLIRVHLGGDEGNRTLDPLLAGQVLSQLSYTPIKGDRNDLSASCALSFGPFWNYRLSKVLPCVILCIQNQLKILPAGHKLDQRPSLSPLGLKRSSKIEQQESMTRAPNSRQLVKNYF